MSIFNHLRHSLSLACLCGVLPLFAFADPVAKSSKDATRPAASDAEQKNTEKKDPGIKDTENKTKPNSPARNKPAVPNKAALKGLEINAEREQTALDFASQHHPELVGLITPLKSSNPKEYQRAIRELFRTADRLSGIRQKDSVRYELELEAWKLQSQIRLLTARLTMATDPEWELQLRETLKKKAENQLKLLQNERESLQARLDQLQKQIDRASQSQDQLVQQEYDRLLKKTVRDKSSVVPKANSGKPAGNKKGSLTGSQSR